MFGIRFIKAQPTTYLMKYKGGRIAREGAGPLHAVPRAYDIAGGDTDRQPRRLLHFSIYRARLSGGYRARPRGLSDPGSAEGGVHAQLFPQDRRQELRVG